MFDSIRIWARHGAALALFLGLTACSGADQFSRHQMASEPSAAQGNAIVVFGLNFRAPNGTPVHGSMSIAWSTYEEGTGRILQSVQFGAERTCFDPRFNVVPEFCEKNLTSYHVVEVKPGNYILSRGTVAGGPRVYETNFHEMPNWTNWTRSAAVGASKAPRFTVAASEAIYIGDYFFFPFSFPARPTGLEFNLAAARAHLAAKVKAPVTLVERRPRQD
jgi:hypothetical protein